MMASTRWIEEIEAACSEPDPAASNRLITSLHYRLSEALANALGRDAGPNFHSWAVWGSRKAGVTIREEDLNSAISNATATAGIVGSAIGAALGTLGQHWIPWLPMPVAAALGAGIGTVTGGWTGRQLAIRSRREAARLVLEANRTVLADIGTQTARFLALLENGATRQDRKCFFAGLRRGPSERYGQDRLAAAFRSYLEALDSDDIGTKREAVIAGNCEIVYHEHVRLEPFIRGAMPWIIRRCATQRLMTYEIGNKVLAAGKDLPGVPARVAASNWTNIEHRRADALCVRSVPPFPPGAGSVFQSVRGLAGWQS